MLAAQVFDIAAQGFDAIARLLEQARGDGAPFTLHDAQLFVLVAQASGLVELPGQNACAHGRSDEGDQRRREERSETAGSGMSANFREPLRVLALSRVLLSSSARFHLEARRFQKSALHGFEASLLFVALALQFRLLTFGVLFLTSCFFSRAPLAFELFGALGLAALRFGSAFLVEPLLLDVLEHLQRK